MDPHQTTASPSSMGENTQPPRSPSVCTPPATYIYNSQPTTPLPATISKFTAFGLNWGVAAPPLSTGESEASGSEFPWGTISTSEALVSPPLPEGNRTTTTTATTTVPPMHRTLSSPDSPFVQDLRKIARKRRSRTPSSGGGGVGGSGSGSGSGGSSNSSNNKQQSKTNFKLTIPPVNANQLNEQAQQHPRHQNFDPSAPQPSIERVTLTSGLPSTILEGQILSTDLSSVPRNFLVRRRSHNDSLARGVGLRGVGGSTLSPATVVQSGTHLQVISGGLPLAMLTPPDEERVITWNPNDAITPSTNEAKVMERPNGDNTRAAHGSNAQQTPSSSDMTPSQEISSAGLETGERSGSTANMEADRSTSDDRPSMFLSGFGQDVWLREALKVLLIPPGLPVRTTTEAVRLIAYTLPCPLPPVTSPAADSPAESSQVTNLPSSAVAAPAVAAAAGYTLSAAMASMCHNSDSGPLETPGGTMIIRPYDGTSTALHTLTAAIQRMYEDASKRVYIHVSHAISPNTPITQIPSPSLSGGNPATPHSAGFFSPYLSSGNIVTANGSDGYFSNIFNSIVVAHEPTSALLTPGITSPSTPGYFIRQPMPNPILPPLSLHYSLLERYIPPPTPAADAALFSPKSSLLLDRVFELSPNGGSLLFIYPTKTGARQFCERYLGKVLDPLLRRLMVLYRLRDDLLWNISRMSAVDHMQEYEGLKNRVSEFCSVLSKGGSEQPQQDGHAPTSFIVPLSVVHSEKVVIQLNDMSWRKWWTQQEYARIRDVIKGHFSTTPSQAPTTGGSANSPSDIKAASAASKGKGSAPLATAPQYNGPADLAREILDGVKASTNRPSSRGMGEAVFASAMVGNAGSWGVVGDGSSRSHPSMAFRPPFGKQSETEGIEVGVFVIRRTG